MLGPITGTSASVGIEHREVIVSPSPAVRLIRRHPAPATILALMLAGLAWIALAAASHPAALETHTMPMPMSGMSDESMRAANDAWFAKHPATSLRVTAAPVDSFTAMTISFDEDHNSGTVVDTARISVGDAILFKYGAGVLHSVVNGTGGADPNAGTLINHSLTSTAENFTFTFTTPGTVPFFCAAHEGFNMRGVVIVSGPLGVGPGLSPHAGFVAPPWPNPTRAGIQCRFAISMPGHARLSVVDAQGRRIARVLDADLPVGETTASWDGRGASGQRVSAGVYFLQLELPGLKDTRRVTIER
jgi:plastocyanin